MFLIDYEVPASNTPPPPLVVGVPGGIHRIPAGLSALDEATWTLIVAHPVAKQHIKVPAIERKAMDAIVGLIGRTWSTAGLDAILEIEASWYGDKPRKVITDAVEQQRKRVVAHETKVAAKPKPVIEPAKPTVPAPRTEAPKAEEPKPGKPKAKKAAEEPKVDPAAETKPDA